MEMWNISDWGPIQEFYAYEILIYMHIISDSGHKLYLYTHNMLRSMVRSFSLWGKLTDVVFGVPTTTLEKIIDPIAEIPGNLIDWGMDERKHFAGVSSFLSNNTFDPKYAVDNVSAIFEKNIYLEKPEIEGKLKHRILSMLNSEAPIGKCAIVLGPNECGKSAALVKILKTLRGVMYIKIAEEFSPPEGFPFLFNGLTNWKELFEKTVTPGTKMFNELIGSCYRIAAMINTGSTQNIDGVEYPLRPLVVLEHSNLLVSKKVMGIAQSFMRNGANVIIMISDGDIMSYKSGLFYFYLFLC
eukprot:TRINITY_DN1639_c0_g1_i2.p1 TRINITY_DN1639_c0_g1~~TRINITY_DN1639_c0_g1_i2.p1  ORF type:complete len:299 (+),score=36.13 TRINITY_DN1639_c0_g1_i2:1026-1922(+)